MNDCTNLLRSARPLELDFELKKESSRPITKAGQASVLVVQESRVSDHGHCCCGVEARQGKAWLPAGRATLPYATYCWVEHLDYLSISSSIHMHSFAT